MVFLFILYSDRAKIAMKFCSLLFQTTVAVKKKVTTEEIGKNVKVAIDENILTITIDLTKTFGKSGSGKSTIIATTSGNKGIGKEDIKLGLNCYTPVKND